MSRARAFVVSLFLFTECDLHAEANRVQVVLDEETAVRKVYFILLSFPFPPFPLLTLKPCAQLLSPPFRFHSRRAVIIATYASLARL